MREQVERKKTQYLLSWCELPPDADHMTFDNFRQSGNSNEAYNAAKRIVDGSLNWLTLISKVDHGKTHLAVAACHEWLKQGKPARYAYVPLLLDELRRGFGVDGKGDYEMRFNDFLNVPLLVLDDLGTENSTPWVQEKLDTIVDYRLMHQLSLIVTTNFSLKRLSERIASRLLRNGEVVTIL
jgi:DNA replication protein DnaC